MNGCDNVKCIQLKDTENPMSCLTSILGENIGLLKANLDDKTTIGLFCDRDAEQTESNIGLVSSDLNIVIYGKVVIVKLGYHRIYSLTDNEINLIYAKIIPH